MVAVLGVELSTLYPTHSECCRQMILHLLLLCVSRSPLLPEQKGYVEMSSAGSIRQSRSVGDVAGLVEEQDTGIYVEPDRTGAALLTHSG